MQSANNRHDGESMDSPIIPSTNQSQRATIGTVLSADPNENTVHSTRSPAPTSSPTTDRARCRRRKHAGVSDQKSGDDDVDSEDSTSAISSTCDEPRPKHALPPCKVCDAPAKGFHYGVNTCEACKGFFRRSIVKEGKYKCMKNERCKLTPGQKGVCAYCRYERCLQKGMSKDGIRIGRYTNEKKTQDIIELQLFVQNSKDRTYKNKTTTYEAPNESLIADITQSQPTIVNSRPTANTHTIPEPVLDPIVNVQTTSQFHNNSELDSTAITNTKQGQIPVADPQLTPVLHIDPTIDPTLTDEPKHNPLLDLSQSTELKPHIKQGTDTDVKCLSPGSSHLSTDPFPSFESLLQTIIQLQEKYFPETQKMFKERGALTQSQMDFQRETDVHRCVFGLSSRVGFSEFAEVYKKTGLELDSRLETFVSWMPILEQGISKQVAHSKSLPGFRTFSLSDQIKLIKHTVIDVWLISRHFAFNTSLGTFTAFTDQMVKTFDVKKVMGEELGRTVLHVASKIQKLELSIEEFLALKTFVIFAPDDCGMEDRTNMERLHEHYLNLLMYTLRLNHPRRPMMVFAGIIEVLTELKTVSHYLSALLANTPMTLLGSERIPMLLQEVLSKEDT